MTEADHDRRQAAFLARVAGDPDRDAFALRGGVLVRHWFPTMRRTPRDVDLLCAWPYDLSSVRTALARILARELLDGVHFAERFRTDPIWPDDAHPGIRLIAPARVEGRWGELRADLTFHLPVWPRAELTTLDEGVLLPTCRPETLIARKLAVSTQRGPRGWRPKDLADLWWMLSYGDADPHTVGDAVERTFSLAAFRDAPGRASFWDDPMAGPRWARFLRQHPRLRVPRDLARVAGEVRQHLVPLGTS